MKALAITATLVVLLLSLGVAVLAVLPSPQPGEQSITVDVIPEGQEGAPTGGNGDRSENDYGVEGPGLAVAGLNDLLNDDTTQPARPAALGEDGSLPAVPKEDLVEQSEYGPLPKTGEDGERPLLAYARPAPPGIPPGTPKLAILMDGLGKAETIAEVLLRLPPEVSVAFGPYGKGLQDWVGKAREKGHEVFLQIPLEPPNYPENDPGPHTLLTSADAAENSARLHWLMSRFTGYVGVTNYLGAAFQSDEPAMRTLLTEFKDRGLVYVSDGTDEDSAAPEIAKSVDLDFGAAVVQIDDRQSPEEIAASLSKLEAAAKDKGTAIAVAEAGPETLQQITKWMNGLRAKGFVLVPVSSAASTQG